MVLLFYSNDVVWHDATFLWGDQHDTIAIVTPDYDVYDEHIFRRDGKGAIRVIAELLGDVRPALGARVYWFAEPPNVEELRRLVRRGRAIVEEACRKKGITLPKYDQVMTPGGRLEPLRDFFGEVPALPVLGSAPSAAGAGATVAPSWPYSREGEGWFLVDPSPLLDLGSEIKLVAGESVFLDDTTCMMKAKDGWLRCEFLAVEKVGSRMEARRAELAAAADPGRAAPAEGGSPTGADGFRRALNPERADDSAAQEVCRLPVVYDAQGERHRPWRDVAAALDFDRFEDWPRTMQWLAKLWARQGASPSQSSSRTPTRPPTARFTNSDS